MFTLSIDFNQLSLGKDHHLVEYKPAPAAEHLPEWFKKLNTLDTPSGFSTAQSCRGVYDVMTSGYLVFWPMDVTISKDENNKLFIKQAGRNENDRGMFHPHPQMQLGHYPDAHLSAQKFGVEKVSLPYKMKTSKKTSLMMIQPPYRPELKTEVMPGVIDTDKFYSPLNVLFTIKPLDFTKDIKISAGTPLAQLVPFVRSEWQIKYNKLDEKLDQTTQENIAYIDKHYQKKLWTRKVFKREGN
jgi:hypothetical protein